MVLGREHELARIDELVDRAQAGSGGVAVLEGPAGIGKTALLAEVTRRADRLGFSVLHGGGARLELEYGFGVVRQLFARALGSRPRASDLICSRERLGSRTYRSGSPMRRTNELRLRAIRRRPCTACFG